MANTLFSQGWIKNSERGSLFFLSRLLVCVFVSLLISGCQSQSENRMFVLSGPIMGTDYRITVVSSGDVDQEFIHQETLKTMERINQSMSHYLESSEVSKVNRLEANENMLISDEFAIVVSQAQAISKLTDGAFDITLAPLIDLWGFGPAGTINKQPTQLEIKSLSESIGYKNILLDGNLLTKAHGATQLNLSAIAKGFAVDKVAETLESHDIQNYLVDIGGELRASGVNIDGQVWRVGIEKPELLGGVQQIITLDSAAIATSGDYLNFLVFDGQRYSHTIDPNTMSPVLHKLASVSVIHTDTSIADALATAMMVMGEDRALEFAEKQQLAAYFIVRDDTGDGVHIYKTSKFAEYVDD